MPHTARVFKFHLLYNCPIGAYFRGDRLDRVSHSVEPYLRVICEESNDGTTSSNRGSSTSTNLNNSGLKGLGTSASHHKLGTYATSANHNKLATSATLSIWVVPADLCRMLASAKFALFGGFLLATSSDNKTCKLMRALSVGVRYGALIGSQHRGSS
jgi:hypothetical protein